MKKYFLKPKYAYQRVELRHQQKIDEKSLEEREEMEQKAKLKMSIGTFNFFTPKPNTMLSNFTLAFSRPIPKYLLYAKLKEALGEYWNGEPVTSIFVSLSEPIPLLELRERLRKALSEIV